MKNLVVLFLSIVVLSCSSSPTISAPETGGTSIEVAMIKGVVVDEQNRPVEGASISFISQSMIPDSSQQSTIDSIKSDENGKFSEEIHLLGTIGVVITDTSGNGAFKPCTLSTSDTIIDLDTIKLEKMGSLEMTLDLSGLIGSEPFFDQGLFFVWSKQFSYNFYFDSTMILNNKEKDTSFVINMKVPAGIYDFRLNPMYLFSMYPKFEIVDTTIKIDAGENIQVEFTPKRLSFDSLSDSLNKELDVVRKIYELNGISNSEKIPDGAGILGNHVGQLIFPCTELDTIPDYISELNHLEWLRFWNSDSLKTVPKSIGDLKNLQMLEFRGCTSLIDLPAELENLTNLKIVWIQGGTSLKKLPEVIYNLSSVERFDIEFT